MSTAGCQTFCCWPEMDPFNVVDGELELSDPSPDIWHLFREFDLLFFDGVLCQHFVELSWSPKMTRTAGLCSWNPSTNFASIRLSKPLLELRSRRDLVETLLHEMIHALLFVKRIDDNHESHGPIFHQHMYRINKMSGANITVYHDFHEEVDYYLKHVWRCTGPCKDRPPYYGWLRRAMNRKPGPNDFWFADHQRNCGGEFVKVEEPAQTKGKSDKKPQQNNDIRNYFSPTKKPPSNIVPFSGAGRKLCDDPKPETSSRSKENTELLNQKEQNLKKPNFVPFSGVGHVLAIFSDTCEFSDNSDACESNKTTKQKGKSIEQKIEVIDLD